MRELREDTFSKNKNEDAHDHVDRVLNIELSTLGTSLKKPLSKGIVHHPRPLNDLKISTTSSRKAMDRYTKLGNGPVPGMTPTQALTTIQTMADHSQKWHEGTSSRNMSSSSDTDGLAAVINEVKYGEFGRPAPFNESSGTKFRVGPLGYYSRTDNQTPSGEKKANLVETIHKYIEEATKRQAEQDEWLDFFSKTLSRIKSSKNSNLRTPFYTPLYYPPEEIEYFSSNSGFSDDEKSKTTKVKTSKAIPEWKLNLPEQMVNYYVEPYVLPIPFPNRLKQHAEEALVHKIMESLKKIGPFLRKSGKRIIILNT
ncbi:hypothetical protein Tco_0875775 [Tanacetum coccineum]|uniref:Uncharacterized protein n=1 Tax=Tanacetum coccineum TaxID=301880 RepID=A0ABQ5BVE8_9ASTR